MDLRHCCAIAGSGPDGRDERGRFGEIERIRLDPFARDMSFELGEHDPEGVAAVEVVVAKCPDEQ